MQNFARLLEQLIFTPSRNGKLRHMRHYFAAEPDPDRGWALAALTGALDIRTAKPAMLRNLAEARIDPTLFRLSYDYVGDMAETIALIWPETDTHGEPPALRHIIETLNTLPKKDIPDQIAAWLDRAPPEERFALLKLITGGLRVGVSARLTKTALAAYGNVALEAVEEIWHALEPPYTSLFKWLDGKSDKPDPGDAPVFRPLMLAHPLDEDKDLKRLDPCDFLAEWKWDGTRVQLVSLNGAVRLYSRTGEDISSTFPDIVEGVDLEGVFDGELLVMRGGKVQSFNALQQRLNRKTAPASLLRDYPAYLRLYDILHDGLQDTRDLGFEDRRKRLENNAKHFPERFDLSPLVGFRDWRELNEKRETVHETKGHVHVEGVMLKRRNSPYIPGRPKGYWFKWKRSPETLDCVLMYAQRGHGKRSSFYSDFTFGCWHNDSLVPTGKAYFGFTDEELRQLDQWVRGHTVARYGPVREVEKALVLEIAFDAIHPSPRHKSGLAMRFPRIARIRWDKPANEADTLANAKALVRNE